MGSMGGGGLCLPPPPNGTFPLWTQKITRPVLHISQNLTYVSDLAWILSFKFRHLFLMFFACIATTSVASSGMRGSSQIEVFSVNTVSTWIA